MKLLSALAALAALSSLPFGASAAPITPAVEYATIGTASDGRPFTLGFSFSLSSPVTVNALGYWDDGLANDHQVGLWDSAANLITSTTVLGTDPLVGHFRWHTIPDLLLAAGSYVIGGEYRGNNEPFPLNATGVTTIAGYTWIEDRQEFGAGLAYPTTTTSGGYGDNGILAADFSVVVQAVPEPASLLLLGVGLAGLGFARRRS